MSEYEKRKIKKKHCPKSCIVYACCSELCHEIKIKYDRKKLLDTVRPRLRLCLRVKYRNRRIPFIMLAYKRWKWAQRRDKDEIWIK